MGYANLLKLNGFIDEGNSFYVKAMELDTTNYYKSFIELALKSHKGYWPFLLYQLQNLDDENIFIIMENSMDTFTQNTALINQIHEKLPILIKEFDSIKGLRRYSVNDENFNSAINSFYFIFQYVPLLTTSLNSLDMPLFRARANDQKNVLFSEVTDISYSSTNIKAIKAGRFNGPGQAVFYASLPVDDCEINPSMAACLETCKGLTDRECPARLKDFTIGRWKIVSPFYVVNFCFDEEHLKGNKSLKHATEVYIKTMKSCLKKEASEFVIDFFTYFSEMSGRRSPTKNEYYI